MSWDAFQRAALQELGLRPYALAASGVEAELAALSPGLRDALARAGGCDVARLATLRRIGPVQDSPQARRALWPQLRGLRTGTR